jgi:hypothetical protein
MDMMGVETSAGPVEIALVPGTGSPVLFSGRAARRRPVGGKPSKLLRPTSIAASSVSNRERGLRRRGRLRRRTNLRRR